MALRISEGIVDALYFPPHDGNLVSRRFIEAIERVEKSVVRVYRPLQIADFVSDDEHDDDLQNAR